MTGWVNRWACEQARCTAGRMAAWVHAWIGRLKDFSVLSAWVLRWASACVGGQVRAQ